MRGDEGGAVIGGLTGGAGDGAGSVVASAVAFGAGSGVGCGLGVASTTIGVVSGGAENMFVAGTVLAGVVFLGFDTRGAGAGDGAGAGAGAVAGAATGAGTVGAASLAISGAVRVSGQTSDLVWGNCVNTYQPAAACTRTDSNTARLMPERFRLPTRCPRY